MFIIVSVFDAGMILPTVSTLTRGPVLSGIVAQIMIPIIALVFVWWASQFYGVFVLKILGRYILFTLVFFSLVYVSVLLASVLPYPWVFDYTTLEQLYGGTPLLSAIVIWRIWKKYCSLLASRPTVRQRRTLCLLIVLFATYWVVGWFLTVMMWGGWLAEAYSCWSGGPCWRV